MKNGFENVVFGTAVFLVMFWLITMQTVDMHKNLMQPSTVGYLASVVPRRSATVLTPRCDTVGGKCHRTSSLSTGSIMKLKHGSFYITSNYVGGNYPEVAWSILTTYYTEVPINTSTQAITMIDRMRI